VHSELLPHAGSALPKSVLREREGDRSLSHVQLVPRRRPGGMRRSRVDGGIPHPVALVS
jgi:hypothetical protein